MSLFIILMMCGIQCVLVEGVFSLLDGCLEVSQSSVDGELWICIVYDFACIVKLEVVS